jgi:probable rRNA maturation factor
METEKATIDIDNRQSRYSICRKTVRKISRKALDALGYPDGELSLVLVDDAQITNLNKEFLKREGPTNVIAFSMREGEFREISPNLLGDVVISLETADREAHEAGLSLPGRFCELLVHGLLHLLGYDHEHSEAEAGEMDMKSREILKIIALNSLSNGWISQPTDKQIKSP